MSSPLWEGVREGCGSCEYGDSPNRHNSLQCRRHPPVMLVVHYPMNNNADQVEAHRPWMAIDDWCGEYKRRRT